MPRHPVQFARRHRCRPVRRMGGARTAGGEFQALLGRCAGYRRSGSLWQRPEQRDELGLTLRGRLVEYSVKVGASGRGLHAQRGSAVAGKPSPRPSMTATAASVGVKPYSAVNKEGSTAALFGSSGHENGDADLGAFCPTVVRMYGNNRRHRRGSPVPRPPSSLRLAPPLLLALALPHNTEQLISLVLGRCRQPVLRDV